MKHYEAPPLSVTAFSSKDVLLASDTFIDMGELYGEEDEESEEE